MWIKLDRKDPATWPKEEKEIEFKSEHYREESPCIGEFIGPGGKLVDMFTGEEIDEECNWGTFFCSHGFLDWYEITEWRYV